MSPELYKNRSRNELRKSSKTICSLVFSLTTGARKGPTRGSNDVPKTNPFWGQFWEWGQCRNGGLENLQDFLKKSLVNGPEISAKDFYGNLLLLARGLEGGGEKNLQNVLCRIGINFGTMCQSLSFPPAPLLPTFPLS